MFFLKTWYKFLDSMADKKFRTIFILSAVGVIILVAAIAAAVILSKDNGLETELPYTDSESESDEESALILNGINVDGMSLEEIEELFKGMAENYSLSISVAGEEAGIINGGDIDFKYNDECGLERYLPDEEKETEAETEKSKRTASSVSRDKAAEESTEAEVQGIIISNLWTYDEEKLNALIENILVELESRDGQSKVALEYSAESGFSVAADEDSRYVDADTIKEEIISAVDNCTESLDIDEDTAYMGLDDDSNEKLSEAVKTLNSYMNSVLNYNFNGELKVIDKEKIHDWFYLDGGLNICIDNDAVQIYTSRLAEAFTDYSNTTPFLTSYGGYINLRTASSNKVDEDTLFNYLMEDIVSGTTVNRTVPYIQANSSAADNNFGGTYVEINLTKQHLFLYSGGNRILDCDIVSGCVEKGYTTPAGVFTIRYKKQNAVLKGVDYSTPVDYWMPFNGGIGLHDATWRTEFGGSIYLTDGSHGCINMPHDAVAALYQYAYAGMYVIVYGGASSLDDAAALEALATESTEESTEESTAVATTRAPEVQTTRASVVTTAASESVITEAPTEAVTEATTEEPAETQPETQEETEPSGEISSESSE